MFIIPFLFSSFGIDGTQAAQGVGKTEYAVHVSDRSFSLQIGANESQTLESHYLPGF